tara:strand:- start:354 stop:1538 length:1185 start_codon:yes stop_codon:yes gene_type:complete
LNSLSLIGRTKNLFEEDILKNQEFIKDKVSSSSFLIIGGAGTIGQAVSKEIFKRNPRVLHVVDINENNLVELVREVRSTVGYISGEFKTFAIDAGNLEFEALIKSSDGYDYVLNLSALKHVRSEADPYTLMRLIDVNILNTIKILKLIRKRSNKFFCVSTDKATNPVNLMGASKKIMEMYLMRDSKEISSSMARFANVAFSDGSLLHGFNQRFIKRQPISAPNDVRRYFITPQESGELCLLSCLLGENRDIFFPKNDDQLKLLTFSEIAEKYLLELGYEPYICSTENEARKKAKNLIELKKWPCYFFESDTTGEKSFEEFFTNNETLDLNRFNNVGVIMNELDYDEKKLNFFLKKINEYKQEKSWSREKIIDLFNQTVENFNHLETGKFLNSKM